MAVYIYPVSTEHNNYPNLTVCDRLRDGEPKGWRVTANEGYVFYDENAEDTILNLETNKIEPITYYYTISYLPSSFNWDNFSYVAALHNSVPEDQFFGDNNEV